MKFYIVIFLLSLGINYCFAQDPAVKLSAAMFDKNQVIALSDLDGWQFQGDHDPAWAGMDVNTANWKKMKPKEVSKKMADENGRIEGWFRLKISLDSALADLPLSLGVYSWGASDIYINGKLFLSHGNTGTNGRTYKGSNPFHPRHISFSHSKLVREHTIAIHFVAYVPPFPLHLITEDAAMGSTILLSGPAHMPNAYSFNKEFGIYQTIWMSVSIVLSLLFWLLAFQNPREKNLLLIAFCSSCFALSALLVRIQESLELSLTAFLTVNALQVLITILMVLVVLVILAQVFKNKVPRTLVIFLGALLIIGYYNLLVAHIILVTIIIAITAVFIAIYYVITSWKTLKGAQWALVAGVLTTLFWVLLWVIMTWLKPPTAPLTISYPLIIAITGIYLSFPLSLLVYVSVRFREIISEVRENARLVVEVTEEKRQQSLNQQKLLEEEVKKQTADLRETLENLRSAQTQLIQSEKMASLGELTAGIAHEIQNPLNFVNNFSEVNKELINEMKAEIEKGNYEQVKLIAHDIGDNHDKINHHGKRAEAIVKGMLQHSRASSGKKEPTDINALADEYLRLAYHGMRAKDKSFSTTVKTNLDPSIGKVNVVPQEIGRVILNLINNAFYAVDEKKNNPDLLKKGKEYEPVVTISTKKLGPLLRDGGKPDSYRVEITVADNGNGISQKVLDKIFQPFFTTKPAGQGTGLGLSLSYDIVKAHGGELIVDTEEGEGTEFIIVLPVN